MAADAHAAGAGAAAAGAAAAAPASTEQLGAAARSNNIEALTTMLDAGADCNSRRAADGMTALHEAAAAGALAAAQLLLEHGADVGAALQVPASSERFNWQPLHFAAAEGHAPLVELLLARGADAAAAGYRRRTPFLEAAWCGHTGAVRAFLDAGVPVDAHCDAGGATALHLAAWKARADVVALLLERGADARADGGSGFTPLHCLLFNPYWTPDSAEQIAQALLAAGANVNALDVDGQSPLHQAARFSNGPVQALLAAGADVEAVEHRKLWRPLHIAARAGNLAAVEALLAGGADVLARDRDGATALHLACGASIVYTEKPLVIAALLAAGADVGAIDNDGRQPLHYFAAFTHQASIHYDPKPYEAHAIKAAAVLMAAGADAAAADSNGATPLMLAAQNDACYDAVVRTLARHSAPPKCRDCVDAARQRAGLQGLVVGAAAEVARLRREQAAWQQERAASEQERTALERGRVAFTAAMVALIAVNEQTLGASSAQQVVGPAAKRPRNQE